MWRHAFQTSMSDGTDTEQSFKVATFEHQQQKFAELEQSFVEVERISTYWHANRTPSLLPLGATVPWHGEIVQRPSEIPPLTGCVRAPTLSQLPIFEGEERDETTHRGAGLCSAAPRRDVTDGRGAPAHS